MTITAKCIRAAVSTAIAILLLALILHGARTPRPAPVASLAPPTPAGPSIPVYRRLIPLPDRVEDVVFSPSGNRLAVLTEVNDDYGMRLQLWDTRSWTPLPAQKPAKSIRAIAFSPDGSILAAVEVDGTLTIRDPLNGRLRRSIHFRRGMVDSMALSPGGDRIAIGYDDGGVEILHTPTMRVERSLSKESKDLFFPGNTVCFSPDGRRLAVCRTDGFRIYNTATWTVQRDVRMGAQVAHMAFISNGQLAVSDDASEHNWATIYDADTGTTGKRLKST
ncbi:MAG TPA: WD40 repeat domain-containing protein, partial [Armatimonadota bacterium]|nr:WD40 repeat domain-containing protein [Armatimonadota bacterium]